MSKGQSKKMSVLEQFANIGVGMIIALITQIITFPLFGLEVTFGNNLAILGIFTVVSFIRGYCFRRVFNWLEMRRERPRRRQPIKVYSNVRLHGGYVDDGYGNKVVIPPGIPAGHYNSYEEMIEAIK
jgi:hypothetical protein